MNLVDYRRKSVNYAKSTIKELTANAFKYPQVGDWFHEMFSFFVMVKGVLPDGSISVKTSVDDVTYGSAEEFSRAYRYDGIDGWWVRYGGWKDPNEEV